MQWDQGSFRARAGVGAAGCGRSDVTMVLWYSGAIIYERMKIGGKILVINFREKKTSSDIPYALPGFCAFLFLPSIPPNRPLCHIPRS